jgi:hypothetical protein
MKATTRLTIYGTFLMGLLGSAFAQHIQTDFDHQANFSLPEPPSGPIGSSLV